MNTRIATLAASLVLSVSGAFIPAAFAAPVSHAEPSVATEAVGSWLHDAQGNTIGSVRSLSDDGRTAVIMIGSYYEPGSHEASVPASDLSVVHDRVTLRSDIVEALNADHLN